MYVSKYSFDTISQDIVLILDYTIVWNKTLARCPCSGVPVRGCVGVEARADLASLLTVKCRGLAPGRVLAGLARSHRQSRHRGCGWRGRALPVHNTPAEPATQLCGHSNLWPQTEANDEISRSFHNMRGRLLPGPSPVLVGSAKCNFTLSRQLLSIG